MLALALLTAAPAGAWAAEARYRVELLVFRTLDAGAAAEPVAALRTFPLAFDLDQPAPPATPLPVAERGQTFANLWTRLQRLGAYEPLAMVSWEQTQVDFHPPVHVHDEEVVAERIAPPAEVVWTDLTAGAPLEEFRVPLFRLDGSAQLRRSRFLHLDLDLEYREDDLQARAFIPPAQPGGAPVPLQPEGEAPRDPFRVHHLRQSRQVKTGEVHYFDTAWLGALVRVTAIAAD